MDTETKEKLTEQQHQIEMLRTDMEANVRTMKAESDSALSKNEAAIAGLRTDIEKSINTITMRMIGVITLAIGLLGVFIAYLQFSK